MRQIYHRYLLLGCLLFAHLSGSEALAKQAISDPNNLRLSDLISFDAKIITEKGDGIIIAVIDSGVNIHLSALKKNLASGWNFISNTDEVVDYSGHGTAVAGIITQLAPQTTILPVAVSNEHGTATELAYLQGIVYAIEQGAHIINISMSFNEQTFCTIRDTIGSELFNKSIFVISAGNEGQAFMQLKEQWDNVLVVGALNLSTPFQLTSYSAFGPYVDLAAPAGGVNDGIATLDAFSHQLRLFNGTSAAAPVVSAALALLKNRFPKAAGWQLKEMILDKSITMPNVDVHQGKVLNLKTLLP